MKKVNYHFNYCYENPYCDPNVNSNFEEYIKSCRFNVLTKGDALSKYYLGLCFEKRGFEGDSNEAQKWYKESGHIYAQLRLAIASDTLSERRGRVLNCYIQVRNEFEYQIFRLESNMEEYDVYDLNAILSAKRLCKNALKQKKQQIMLDLGAIDQDLNKVKQMIAFLKSKIRYIDFLIEEEKTKRISNAKNYWGSERQEKLKRSQQQFGRFFISDTPRELLISMYRECLSKEIYSYKMDEENTKLALCWLEDYLKHI